MVLAQPNGSSVRFRDTKEAEEPTRDGGSDHAEHDVQQKPHFAFHKLLGEATRRCR
jgi:hypothetical protein